MAEENPDLYSRIRNWIESHIATHPTIPLLFVSGAQGIGKSTTLRQIERDSEGRIVILSLDDFYLSKAERLKLAEAVSPLFEVRGPPGTHDVELLDATLDDLLALPEGSHITVPVFDKRLDNRRAQKDWRTISARPQAIILEGWCLGLEPQGFGESDTPINAVEARDKDGVWRRHQEHALATSYAKIWDRADGFLHLLAPDFDQVLHWRSQQELTNLGLVDQALPEDRQRWVADFIQHYERLTRRMLSGGHRSGYCMSVNRDRTPQPVGTKAPNFIVFSDLDGTLLDHDTYEFSGAKPALEAVRKHGGMLVLASSKTAAEILPIRAALGFEHCPAIVENGAGILPAENFGPFDVNAQIPVGKTKGTYAHLLMQLNALPSDLRTQFTGFSDLTHSEVMQETGLSDTAAAQAKDRQFSEPGIWTGSDTDLSRFRDALHERGISTRSGGRFLTLSFGGNKAQRMQEIASRYHPVPTLALGDAPNDLEMLRAAHRGVIASNPRGAQIPPLRGEKSGRIRRLEQSGPSAWNDAVLSFIKEVNLNRD
ncbi:MAG: HAD hydrolase family protein [Pseudomonadota bacterium]